MNTDEILDMMDHAHGDVNVSDNAMRWKPDLTPQERLKLGDMLTVQEVQAQIFGRQSDQWNEILLPAGHWVEEAPGHWVRVISAGTLEETVTPAP